MKRRGTVQTVVLVLLFFSGFSSLIYEVVWQGMLNLVFGNTSFATAIVVAAFMAGMALGSWCFSRIADRADPLTVYAFLELGIGVFAIVFPFLVAGLSTLNVGIIHRFSPPPFIAAIVKSAFSFCVLLVPGALMGGTLPLLSTWYVNASMPVGRGIGRVYGVNTIGGVVGAFSAAFMLMTSLGIRETTYLAAGINAAVAGVAFTLTKLPSTTRGATRDQRQIPDEARGRGRTETGTTRRAVLVVYAISGFCALAYEVLWTRVLVFFIGRSNHAFAVMLTTFLLALALGSFLYARLLSRSGNPLRLLAFIETLIGIFALLSLWAFSRLGNLTEYLYGLLGNGWYALLVARYAGSFLVMFIPTLLIGFTFPLVNRLYAEDAGALGRSVGTTYALNTVGCILGSFMAGFVLIPTMGITKSIVLIGLLNAALGTVLAVVGMRKARRAVGTLAVTSAALVAVAVLAATSSGIILQRVNRGDTLRYYHEGTSSTVAVVSNDAGYNDLLVNGIYEVPTDYGALRTFHMLGALPLLLHHDAENALVLCFGAGITTGAVARHGLDRIDAVELSREVVAANTYFTAENQAVLSDPSVHLTVNDGRNFLLQTTARYDVIISDATHPDSGDSWVLYTREFYELCRARLNPRGIMTQWLPMHALAPIDYKTILKTFQSVFPQTSLWFTNEHTVMVGATDTFTIDLARLAGKLRDSEVKKDLAPFFLNEVDSILASFVMGPRSLADYTREAEINTDDHPFVLSSEMRSRVNTISLNLMELSEATESVSPYLTGMEGGVEPSSARYEAFRSALVHLLRAQSYYYRGALREQIAEYRMALAINPEDENTTHLLSIAEAVQR